MSTEVIIRIPAEFGEEFRRFWSELRVSDSLPPEFELGAPAEIAKFDGQSLYEWLIPVAQTIAPVISAVLGYLAAKKGEVEIRSKENILKFKNLTPKQIAAVVDALDRTTKDQ